MIDIFIDDNRLLLRYTSNDSGVGWVDNKLQSDGSVTLRRTFTFRRSDLLVEADLESGDERTFLLGVTDNDYYRISRNILRIKHDLLISISLPVSDDTFTANRNISIFGKIDDLVNEPIIVGGESEGAIPVRDFEDLLQNFPTTTELTHYASARISRTLKDYLGTISDSQRKLDTYLNKNKTIRTKSRVKFLESYEPTKFEYVRDELKLMLEDADTYSEKDWQKLIVDFLLLIFPKYIAVLENLHIKDFYSNTTKATDRYIDFTLVDANGVIDIVEIKKPFANCLLSTNKYRDSYTPKKELSGSVMQVEKYIFHLSKWGRAGEVEIQNKRKTELPPDFEIKISNPKAMIILGRNSDFTGDQIFDFEIIKRKYANIIDIMTYDDLLRRLENIILMISNRAF